MTADPEASVPPFSTGDSPSIDLQVPGPLGCGQQMVRLRILQVTFSGPGTGAVTRRTG
jgi:hypothetical protein